MGRRVHKKIKPMFDVKPREPGRLISPTQLLASIWRNWIPDVLRRNEEEPHERR